MEIKKAIYYVGFFILGIGVCYFCAKGCSCKFILDWLSNMEADTWVAIATIFIALFTFFAAIGALFSAHYTQKTARGQLLSKLIEEYSKENFADALRTLEQFKNNNDIKKIHDEYKGDKRINPEKARRKVQWFFKKVCELKKAGSIDDDEVQILTKYSGFDLWIETALPMSMAVHSNNTKEELKKNFSYIVDFADEQCEAIDKKYLKDVIKKLKEFYK